MAKIKKIQIENYRSCIKTTLELSTDLTTLIGINGVGKSNILKSILLLTSINRNRYFHQKQLQDSMSQSKLDLLLEIDGINYQLRSVIYYDTDENNSEEIHSVDIKLKPMGVRGVQWTEIDPKIYEIFDYLRRSSKLNEIDQYIRKSTESDFVVKVISYLTNISYYSATQFSDPTNCPVSLELEDSRLARPYRRTNTHDQFIFDLYKTYKSDQKAFKRYISTVNKEGIGLIDDFTFFDHEIPSSSYKVRAGGKIQKIEKTKNIIIPSVFVDNLSLSPNQLSEGTFKTLALIFYILNDQSDLLLIEEPEVCVHHGLLSSIIELIKIQSKQKQILISTHSDFVLDKLNPENVILVKKSKIKGTTATSLPKSMSRNDFSALKKYLERTGNLGEYWKEGGFENE